MADKHYAGRWICQRDAKDCIERLGAMRAPYFVPVKCPLAHRCAETIGTVRARGQLEHWYPKATWATLAHELRVVTSDSWNEDHNRRHRGLVQAFDPEQIRKRTRQWKAEHRDQINATQRRKRMKAQRDTPPPSPRDAPPCGGDCENCPWDDGCHYEDWEAPPKWRRDYQQLRRKMEEDPEYADHKRTLANERNRRYRVHQKQRMADDSEYAERMRQSKKDKDRKYRAQQKQRMADNPEYAELMRQRKREQNRKYRAQKKEAKK